ncbi:MAG: hypothetical protein RSA29_14555 [Clostridium sp.]|uniref:hypothetical protein n=1 Tax=Clostridium sp. TaxID=1506 RepID=UPI003217499C
MRHYNNLVCVKKSQFKSIIAVGLLIWGISSVYYISNIEHVVKSLHGYSLCNIDFIFSFDISSILQDTNFTYMINPLFCACALYLITINSRVVSVIRYSSKGDLWNNNFLLIILLSFVISVLLVFGTYLIGGIVLGNFSNTWHTNTGYFHKVYGNTNIWSTLSETLTTTKILFIIFVSTFIRLSMFGSIINILSIFIKQSYVFIVMISLVFIDYTNVCAFSPLKSQILKVDDIININNLIIKNLCCVFVIGSIYILGKFFRIKKDQFIEKNNL